MNLTKEIRSSRLGLFVCLAVFFIAPVMLFAEDDLNSKIQNMIKQAKEYIVSDPAKNQIVEEKAVLEPVAPVLPEKGLVNPEATLPVVQKPETIVLPTAPVKDPIKLEGSSSPVTIAPDSKPDPLNQIVAVENEVKLETPRIAKSAGYLVPMTKILMSNGLEKSIQDIHAGEDVINPVTGKIVKIINVLESLELEPIIEITVGNKSVRVSQNQFVRTPQGVVLASQIKVGDLISLNGTEAQASKISQVEVKTGQLVFNLRLEGEDSVENHFLLSDGIITGDLAVPELIK